MTISSPDLDYAMGLRGLAVDVNLAVLAGLLRFRSGFEEAGDIEPEIEAHSVVLGSWFFVRRSGFGVMGSAFWVRRSGFGVLGSAFWVRRSRFGVQVVFPA